MQSHPLCRMQYHQASSAVHCLPRGNVSLTLVNIEQRVRPDLNMPDILTHPSHVEYHPQWSLVLFLSPVTAACVCYFLCGWDRIIAYKVCRITVPLEDSQGGQHLSEGCPVYWWSLMPWYLSCSSHHRPASQRCDHRPHNLKSGSQPCEPHTKQQTLFILPMYGLCKSGSSHSSLIIAGLINWSGAIFFLLPKKTSLVLYTSAV